MDVLLTIAVFFIFVFAANAAFRPGADSPSWELRWRGLGADDRERISIAARSRAWRALLTDGPTTELELAAGLRRRDCRHRAYVQLAALPLPIVAAALMLDGVLAIGAFALVISLYGLFTGVWSYLRVQEMSGKPRAATSPDAGL